MNNLLANFIRLLIVVVFVQWTYGVWFFFYCCQGRPKGAREGDVYICEFRVDKTARLFYKINRPRYPVSTKPYCFDHFDKKLQLRRTFTVGFDVFFFFLFVLIETFSTHLLWRRVLFKELADLLRCTQSVDWQKICCRFGAWKLYNYSNSWTVRWYWFTVKETFLTESKN